MAEITTLGAPIKTAYEGQPNTNAFTDAEKTKLGDLPTNSDLQDDLDLKVSSDITGISGADAITNMVSLTQAEYDLLTPSATTFYVITDA